MEWYRTDNRHGRIPLRDLPQTSYDELYGELAQKLLDPACHPAHYFTLPGPEGHTLYCLLLDDAAGEILACRSLIPHGAEPASLTAVYPGIHPFERDAAERHGIRFRNSMYDKPLRTPEAEVDSCGSSVRQAVPDDFPFYRMEGESLHEVNVGPIHAGIIEPGAFRFICNGEQVMHLEIALGYQHRGVERLIEQTANRRRQALLAESTAGDASVTHAAAYARIIEYLTAEPCYRSVTYDIEVQRCIALEMERLAMHLADTGALCMDIGYQLGQTACEALRTVTINTTQYWCGNRFGKGLVRPMGSYYPLTEEIRERIQDNVADVMRRYDQVRRDLKDCPSLLARLEDCGTVARAQLLQIGAVGMAARAGGLLRDIRATHPWACYGQQLTHEPVTREQGDAMARLTIRCREGLQSAAYVLRLLEEQQPAATASPEYDAPLAPDTLAVALVEGWRGETCHCALTDRHGRIAAYRIKDPSLHNWTALALAVRGEGISDFPVCNKSFNLSYCGHDL